MISQKIGQADETNSSASCSRKTHDFHGSRPLAQRDNWLVGKEWFQEAVKMVDTLGVSMMGKGPLIYRSSAPMCQMSYADNLEKDGTFGEVAKGAWVDAADEWHRYGDEDIPTSWSTRKPRSHRDPAERQGIARAGRQKTRGPTRRPPARPAG